MVGGQPTSRMADQHCAWMVKIMCSSLFFVFLTFQRGKTFFSKGSEIMVQYPKKKKNRKNIYHFLGGGGGGGSRPKLIKITFFKIDIFSKPKLTQSA